jgi:homoserine dehydrogenase
MQQKGRKTDGSVPVVMVSHLAREADVQKALSEINRLDVVSEPTMLIRIEDDQLD